MNKPLFNFKPILENEKLPYNNEKLLLMYIDDIKPYNEFLLFSQMCDAGYRIGKENVDYLKWNQCVFEDIDYKFYIYNHESYIEPLKIYKDIYEYLYNNYRNFIYYSELSRHLNGFHFIFYFSVGRTKNNRLMCKSLCNFIIHQAFEVCGYKDIIEYSQVYDDCTDSFYQPCFLTKNKYNINNECNGIGTEEIINSNYFTIKNIYEKLANKELKKERKINNIKNGKNSDKDDIWQTEYILDNSVKYNGEYLNHHERYRIFKSIVGLCGRENENEIKEEWEKCAEQLPEGNGHDLYFYNREPYKNNWLNWIDNNEEYCYVDEDLLGSFGYDIKFKNINKDKNGNKTNKKTNKIRKEKVYL